MPEPGYQREAERDIVAGLEMARYLLSLSTQEFDTFRESDLHIIPRASWMRLSAQEKADAKAMGIEARCDDYQTHAGISVDDLPIADAQLFPEVLLETEEDEGEEPNERSKEGGAVNHLASLSADEQTWYALRSVLDLIISDAKPRLAAECLRLAAGLGSLDNLTESSIARKHGISRAAVSKRCVKLTKLLKLRPSQFMKPLEAREVYRRARYRSLQKQAAVDEGIS